MSTVWVSDRPVPDGRSRISICREPAIDEEDGAWRSDATAEYSANAPHPHDLIPAANGHRPRVPPTLEPRRSTRGAVEARAGPGSAAAGRYQPRRPNQRVRYRCIEEHLETWLAHRREGLDDARRAPECEFDQRIA